jgi:hypothetical protein
MKIFVQDQEVVVRRIYDDGSEYRAKVVGLASTLGVYILEMVDRLPGQIFSHITMPDGCIDEV